MTARTAPETPFPPDAAARAAAADPSRNIVLRASAGTGKTTVLKDRYLRLVGCGVPPRNILALTFTRKAAQEMKDRILRELVLARPAEIAEVRVSTLDAFTLGLIREFPLDAGVSPGIEILDERSMPVVREEAIRRVFSGATGFDREVLGALPGLLDRSNSQVAKAVHDYLDRRLIWARHFEELAGKTSRGAAPRLRVFLAPVARECARLRAVGADPSVGMPLSVRLALDLAEQPRSRDALDLEALGGFFRYQHRKPPRGLPETLHRDFRAVKERVDGFRSRWLIHRNDRALGAVWRLFRAAETEYQRLKEERGVMDFDDLTTAATRLFGELEEFSASRVRLEARYHHLLLDEFHDTSDPQWELLRAVIRPWTEGMGLAAEEVSRVTNGRLTRPTIFVVGDHKQSIYRFRDARVEILRQAEQEIGRLGAPGEDPKPGVVLRWNFRSSRLIRRFVNAASRRVAAAAETNPEDDWAFRYEEDDHLPEGEAPADARSGEVGLAVPGAALSVSVGTEHEEVAARIAARIATLVREHEVSPEQIALLARNATKLATYRAAVEAAGIPTYLVRGSGFFETSEVRDLRALTRFLARPHSDRRAVELLRSRFFGCSDETLVRIRRASSAPTPFADLVRGDGDDRPDGPGEPLGSAASEVPDWIRLARRLPPAATLERILRRTRYLDRAATRAPASPETRQREANVRKLLGHLRSFERGGFATMEQVAERLQAAAAGDTTEAPVRAADAVQALSIHAAKGLEFDQVFLVDCGGSGRGETGIPRVQERGRGDWTIALVRDAPAWKLDDGGRARSEERRCLYVALTRPRHGLCLSWITRFTKRGVPYKPRGLAGLLPPDLFGAASQTVRNPRPAIAWEGFDIEVLPPVAGAASGP